MQRVLIFGLVLLAAFLPLAVMPPVTMVFERRLFVVEAATFVVSAGVQPVALLALDDLRAPPSR